MFGQSESGLLELVVGFVTMKAKLFGALGVLVALSLSLGEFGWLWFHQEPDQSAQCEQQEPQLVASESGQILVDVRGEVAKPGVYRLSNQQRLGEAIASAGGLTKEANPQYVLHALNFAKVLSDQEKIYIPNQNETSFCSDQIQLPVTKSQTADKNTVGGNDDGGAGISINTAQQSELESLPGIGEKRAADIVAGRPYSSIGQLLDDGVVTATIFTQIQSHITL